MWHACVCVCAELESVFLAQAAPGRRSHLCSLPFEADASRQLVHWDIKIVASVCVKHPVSWMMGTQVRGGSFSPLRDERRH